MPITPRGFTLIELMVVLAVIAILATLALPDLQSSAVRSQIIEAAKLADVAKAPVAELIVSNYVSALRIEDGAIHMVFGNKAHGKLIGKTLTFPPAVVPDTNVVPISWLCGHATAPNRMAAQGRDRTDVPRNVLPINCTGH